MKFKLILAALAALAANVKAQEAAGACASHPLLEKLEAFALEVKEGLQDDKKDQSDASALTTQLEELKKRDGDQAPEADSFVACESFEGSNSCCTPELVQSFDKVVKRFVRSKVRGRNKKPVQKIFLEKFIKGASKCIEDKEIIKTLKGEIEKIFSTLKSCHREKINSQAKVIHGSLCSLCFEPANDGGAVYNENFNEDGQLIVYEGDGDEMTEEMEGGITCFNDVVPDIQALVTPLLEHFTEGKCLKFAENIKQVIEDGTLKVQADQCKSRQQAFGGGCGDDQDAAEEDYEGLDPESSKQGSFKPPKQGRDKPSGDGDKPQGEKPEGGKKPEGEKPEGEKPEGEKPEGGKKPEGEKPEGEKPSGEKPSGEKPSEPRLLQEEDEDTGDFYYSGDMSAYGVYASQGDIGAENELFDEDDEQWGINEEDLPEYNNDLTLPTEDNDSNSTILKVGLGFVAFMAVLF